ncbi:MAG: hypothetical protein QOJ99_1595 [Bryobacterales bacterium]|jgi:hypothetical protein|nr:hypothetical protein [Bryobacterales bacterium]
MNGHDGVLNAMYPAEVLQWQLTAKNVPIRPVNAGRPKTANTAALSVKARVTGQIFFVAVDIRAVRVSEPKN